LECSLPENSFLAGDYALGAVDRGEDALSIGESAKLTQGRRWVGFVQGIAERLGNAVAPALIQLVVGIKGGEAHGYKSTILGDGNLGPFVFEDDAILPILPALTLRKGGVAFGEDAPDVFDKIIPFVGFGVIGDNGVEVNGFNGVAVCGY
jgi:hypothetical protein